jgi:hypothetical protein|tara:strand:+ start:478 stop:765 length:288 start_codon:yes stop_codon:yes gene_type:complete
MPTLISWGQANSPWNNNSFTWDDAKLIRRAAGEDWNVWEQKDKKKLIKLILKIHGNTITESKKKEIKQYKIKATDIRIAVKKVLSTQMIAENISI